MSRLNIIMALVTDPELDRLFYSIPVKQEGTLIGINKHNELIRIYYSDTGSERRRIPKEKVVQIVAGFSEIA